MSKFSEILTRAYAVEKPRSGDSLVDRRKLALYQDLRNRARSDVGF
jgi:hypothetical protein